MRASLLALATCLLLSLALVGHVSAAVYWNSGTSIGRANLDGSVAEPDFIPIPLVADGSSIGCGGVAVDDRYVYWSDQSRHSIGRANLDGTDPQFEFIPHLNNSIFDGDGPCGLDLDGSYLYWAEGSRHSIGRANLDGTEVNPEFLITASPWTDNVEAHNGFLYWVAVDAWLSRARLNGEEPIEPLIDRDSGRGGLAVTDSQIYWPDIGSSIARANLDGSGLEEDFISGLERPCDVSVLGSSIYWIEDSAAAPAALGRANLDGSGVESRLVPDAHGCGITTDEVRYTAKSLPPNEFAFARVKHGRHRPITLLAVDVPTRTPPSVPLGAYDIDVPRGLGWNLLTEEPYRGKFFGPGRKWFAIYPHQTRAGRRISQAVERRRRFAFHIAFHYTADGHTEMLKERRLTLLPASRGRQNSRRHGGGNQR